MGDLGEARPSISFWYDKYRAMRLFEITSQADKLRLYQMKKAAIAAKHKAAMERYRQQIKAYDEKARMPRKPGQKLPIRPTPPPQPKAPHL